MVTVCSPTLLESTFSRCIEDAARAVFTERPTLSYDLWTRLWTECSLRGLLKDLRTSRSPWLKPSGAAQKASILMTAGEATVELFTAKVDEDLCSGCRIYESLCAYGAIELKENEGGKLGAHIIEVLCKGCGTCATACPTKAIHIENFTDEQTLAQVEAILN